MGWIERGILGDRYPEFKEAGVMPGNLEDDRLLTGEEIWGCGMWLGKTLKKTLEAQDAKTSKWWIEKIENARATQTMFCSTSYWGYCLMIPEGKWLALKKQIGGE